MRAPDSDGINLPEPDTGAILAPALPRTLVVDPPFTGNFRLGDALQCLLFSWALLGHQTLVLVAVYQDVATRDLTILSRVATAGLSLLTIVCLAWRMQHVLRRFIVVPFVLFWGFYFLRLFLSGNVPIAGEQEAERFTHDYILRMAVGACFIPSAAVLVNTCWNWHETARRLCVGLAAVSATLMLLLYGPRLMAFDSRIQSGDLVDGVYAVHPLSLGYLGAALLVLAYHYCCLSRGHTNRYLLAALLAGLGIPLLVGSASRGPVIALAGVILTLLFSLVWRRAFGRALAVGLVTGITCVAVIIVAEATGSSIFERLLGLREDIAAQASSTDRLMLYRLAFDAFLDSPLIGSAVLLPGREEYPHNLFLESLMATGLAGTLPLVVLVGLSVSAGWRLLVQRAELGWVPLLFLLYLFGGMFSWSIFTNVELWLCLGATLSCAEWQRRQRAQLRAWAN